LKKFTSASRINSASEATIAADLAYINMEAEIQDKAEEYFRKALSLGDSDPDRINALAWFLIEN